MHTHASSEKSSGSSFLNKKKTQPFFAPLIIQPKLTIGPVDDPYEREADAMADKVMRMSDPSLVNPTPAPVIIQKKCAACEEEEKLQRKEENEEEQMIHRNPIADLPVLRKCDACDQEESLSRKESSAHTVPGISPSVHQSLQSAGHGLDVGTRSFMESRFGYDFSKVQVHNDWLAHQSSSDIKALAYTHGQHIVFGAGQYQPNTNTGKQLLAHELTHVIQQDGINPERWRILRQPAPPGRATTIDSKDGNKYSIKRDYQVTTGEKERYAPPKVRPGIDTKDVYLEVSWCFDKRGNLRIGANIPQQAEDLLKRIATSLGGGGSEEQVKNELKKTDLTPFVNLQVAKSGSWDFSIRTNVTVDSSGFKGAGGSVVIDAGAFKITGSVSESRDKGFNVIFGVEIPLGSNPKEFTCKTVKVPAVITPTDSCEKITPAHEEPAIENVPGVDEKTTYIYFNYATEKIESVKTDPEISKLKSLLQDDYSITKITGYTSPEGLKQKVPGFRGNDKLSRDRTDAAYTKATKTCSEVQKDHSDIICSGITTEIQEFPDNSELYTATKEVNGETKEVEGDELIKSTESQFLESTEEKRFTDDPEFKSKLEKAKTPKQKEELIYPMLRRAKILLTKSITIEKHIIKQIEEKRGDVKCDGIQEYAKIKNDWDLEDNVQRAANFKVP